MGRRAVWVTIAVAIVAAGLILGWPGRREHDPTYVTAVVDRGPITATITATGTVNPLKTVQVGTYVSGPIQAIFVDFNTRVTRGQPLAKIDPRPFQVKLDAARADLANAKAKLAKDRADADLKRVTLRRNRELMRGGIVAQSDYDLAASQDEQARAQIALDEADIQSKTAALHEAEVNLAYTDIVSPVDGVVVSRNVDVGQTVAATFQTPTLFLVAEDLTKMLVDVSVSESDIGGVADGQPARFSVDAYPGMVFEGRVSEVRNAPTTVQNVVTYDVIVHVDNQDLRLKPGMTANVTIVTAEHRDALRVATSALRFRPPRTADSGAAAAEHETPPGHRVWMLDAHGEPRPVPVEIGIADDRFTEITSGLAPGDRVVVARAREETAAPRGRPPSFGGVRRR
ncbi:MAG TPA: efflux RND transporter periplasmic adaptor subunit [Candidatus Binatia bacterium]|jgi:HlyD family secretion protein|nr:efflux RND transporter periplasmic adaptor subunit [Candidatus Binatia bacterium]